MFANIVACSVVNVCNAVFLKFDGSFAKYSQFAEISLIASGLAPALSNTISTSFFVTFGIASIAVLILVMSASTLSFFNTSSILISSPSSCCNSINVEYCAWNSLSVSPAIFTIMSLANSWSSNPPRTDWSLFKSSIPWTFKNVLSVCSNPFLSSPNKLRKLVACAGPSCPDETVASILALNTSSSSFTIWPVFANSMLASPSCFVPLNLLVIASELPVKNWFFCAWSIISNCFSIPLVTCLFIFLSLDKEDSLFASIVSISFCINACFSKSFVDAFSAFNLSRVLDV